MTFLIERHTEMRLLDYYISEKMMAIKPNFKNKTLEANKGEKE